MKVFISWSGVRSRAIAEALNDWLRRVIQAVKPFYSPEIEKGANWSSEIDEALEGTKFGIICLTPDNLRSVWIHYEAGALSKTKDASVWTFLHGLSPGDVPPPLGKFQHTVAEKKDVLKLLRSINRRLADVGGEPLQDLLLEENFELFWPRLEGKLHEAEKLAEDALPQTPEGAGNTPRGEGAKLDEILDLVRSQERRLLGIEDRLSTLQPREHSARKLADEVYLHTISFTVVRDGEIDTEAVARSLAVEVERLEPLSNTLIGPVTNGHYVNITLPEPVSRSKVRALLDTIGRRAKYDITSWGGHPV